MTEPIKLPDLEGMAEAFSRVIEAHRDRFGPFCNPIAADAAIALRELRSLRFAVEQNTAELLKELTTLQRWYADVSMRAEKAEAEVERLRAELARLTKLPSPPPLWDKGCPVCGIGSQPGVYGVVCARGDCPTRVTCGVTK